MIGAIAAGREQGLHLHPRRVRAAGRHPRRRAGRGLRRAATSASGSWARSYSFDLVVHRGAGAYICGEETALLDSLEGKRGNPRLKPPFPANQGLYQGPTLINNVETLCNVPAIIARGADWFQSLGDGEVDGHEGRVGVRATCSAPATTRSSWASPAREIVYGLAGGPPEGRSVKCWFPGGSSAPVLLEEHLDLPYDFEAMAQAGSMLGSGADHRGGRLGADRAVALRAGRVLPPRVVRQVRAVPRGHQLDREDARAGGLRRGHAHGPRDHGPGPGEHHRQLPLRARRLDGDADRRR